MEGRIFLDGDFKSKLGNCKYHCSPSCHPAQTGQDWKYGCRHTAWPQNRARDFVPIVKCGGDVERCEIPLSTIGNLIGGKKRSISSTQKKLARFNSELKELENMKRLR